MNQEPFYPSKAAGEDIQQLLPENIGLAFKMVWDAPADSPEALKQAIEKIARTRKGAGSPRKRKTPIVTWCAVPFASSGSASPVLSSTKTVPPSITSTRCRPSSASLQRARAPEVNA